MEARVKADYRWNTLMAFAGREYVKSDWRPVPFGHEDEAERHANLETRPSTGSGQAGAAQGVAEAASLDDMTVAELQELARAAGVSYSGLRKAELIAALEEEE